MNTLKKLGCVAAGLLVLAGSVEARLVKIWSPAELYERADLVVVGKPIKIESTGRKGIIQLGETNPLVPVAYHSAEVEVIEIIKGKPSAREITIEYSLVDYDRLDPPISKNGPGRFSLEEGGIFLLYLNEGEDGEYVGTLYGEFDDDQACKVLVSAESMSGE